MNAHLVPPVSPGEVSKIGCISVFKLEEGATEWAGTLGLLRLVV